MIRLFRVAAILLVATFSETSFTSSAFYAQNLEAPQFHQLPLGGSYLYQAPKSIHKSQNGAQWIIYEQFILLKRGLQIQKLKLPGDFSAYLSIESEPTIKVADFLDTVVISYNSQLIYFDLSENQFKSWFHISDNQIVTGLQTVAANTLWITTTKDIYQAKSYNKSAEKINIPDSMMEPGIPTILPYSLEKDDESSLWIGSFLSRIYRVTGISSEELHFEQFKYSGDERLIIFTIKKISNNKLLLGTSSGLYEFDISSKQYEKYNSEFQLKNIQNIAVTNNDIWFTSNGDLYFKSLTSDIIKKHTNKEQMGLPNENSAINSVYTDNEDIVWLSVESEGVYSFSPYLNKIKKLDLLINIKNNTKMDLFKLNESELIYSDDNNTFINQTTIRGNSASSYKHTDGSHYFGQNNAVSKYRDGKLNVKFTLPGVDSYPTAITIDYRNRIWVSDPIKGLHIWDDDNSQLIDSSLIKAEDQGKAIFLAQSNNKNIHLVTRNKVKVISTLTDSIIDEIKLSSDAINVTQNENILVIYHNDLSVSRYNIEDHSLNNLIFSEIENIGCVVNNGGPNWWLAINNGELVKYNSENESKLILSEKDGVPKGGLTGSFCGIYKGELFFSSHRGFVSTTPNLALKNTIKPTSRISAIKTRSGQHLSLSNNKNIKIEQNDFPIEIKFYHSSLVSPEDNKSRYILKGLNNEWIDVNDGTTHRSFSNLAPGDYEFLVQGTNNDWLWGDPVAIDFTVLPHIWLTWWAKGIYVLSSILLFYFFYRIRTHNLHQRTLLLEETVKRRTNELEQILDQKNEEFANVSHEFRTPLTLILGPIKKLLQNEEVESKKTTLESVKRNGYRLLRMVDQLLHMEKFRVQQIVSRTPIKIKPIAKLIGESFQDLAQEKQITLNIEQLDDVWLLFTPDAFEKILLNLLSNAIKYTLPNGKINLSIKHGDNNKVEIIVADTGIGIETEQQALVFGRFNRVLNEHSEQVTGAGIGLALVKDLVEKHQGTISLQSEIGKGSTFTVLLSTYLPNVQDESLFKHNNKTNSEIISLEIESILEQKLNIQTSQEQIMELNGKTSILVVEDNPDMRNYITATLSSHYQVLVANNGKQGLDVATEQIPDLIISDVMMPIMDGYTLCHSLKSQELTSHIPLILLTARSDRDSRLKGWKNQADEYLTKPFDTEELLLRVENLLNIRELLKQRLINKTQEIRNIPSKSIQPEKQSIITSKNLSNDNIETDSMEWEDQERLFIDKFTLQLEKNIENPDLKVDQIAKKLAMSERQLYRKLKGVLNVTPADYLRNFRLEKALELIKQGEPVSNVAFDVGFTSHSYFSRCFKAKYGTTPTEFIDS